MSQVNVVCGVPASVEGHGSSSAYCSLGTHTAPGTPKAPSPSGSAPASLPSAELSGPAPSGEASTGDNVCPAASAPASATGAPTSVVFEHAITAKASTVIIVRLAPDHRIRL